MQTKFKYSLFSFALLASNAYALPTIMEVQNIKPQVFLTANAGEKILPSSVEVYDKDGKNIVAKPNNSDVLSDKVLLEMRPNAEIFYIVYQYEDEKGAYYVEYQDGLVKDIKFLNKRVADFKMPVFKAPAPEAPNIPVKVQPPVVEAKLLPPAGLVPGLNKNEVIKAPAPTQNISPVVPAPPVATIVIPAQKPVIDNPATSPVTVSTTSVSLEKPVVNPITPEWPAPKPLPKETVIELPPITNNVLTKQIEPLPLDLANGLKEDIGLESFSRVPEKVQLPDLEMPTPVKQGENVGSNLDTDFYKIPAPVVLDAPTAIAPDKKEELKALYNEVFPAKIEKPDPLIKHVLNSGYEITIGNSASNSFAERPEPFKVEDISPDEEQVEDAEENKMDAYTQKLLEEEAKRLSGF